MAITLRSSKGSNLTANEVDNNFTELSGSIRNILTGTSTAASASTAVTASHALTASYAMNASGGGIRISNPYDLNSQYQATTYDIQKLQFLSPITLSFNDTTASITTPNPSILIKDEGTEQGYVTALDFVGSGISVANANNTATITVSSGGDLSAVASDILPEFDGVYDLGASDKKWFDGYFANQITLGTGSISDSDGDITIDTNVVVQGIVSADIADFGNVIISGSTIYANSFGNAYDGISDSNTLTVEGTFGVNGGLDLSYPIYSLLSGVWSYGDTLNTARSRAGGAGTQQGAITVGGLTANGGTATSEEYNGFNWNYGGNTVFNVSSAGAIGDPTNAQFIGGGFDQTQTYDGTAWSIDTYNIVHGWMNQSSAGKPTTGIAIGGMDGGTGQSKNDVFTDDGAAWSIAPSLSYQYGIQNVGAAGTQTATIIAGGDAGTFENKTWFFDGIAWTQGPNVSSGMGPQLVGNQTEAMLIGGYENMRNSTKVQIYDGITWADGTPRLTGTGYGDAAGTATNALAFGGEGGQSNTNQSVTEIYDANYVPKSVVSYSAEDGFVVLSQVSQSLDFANDAAAEAGGVPLGGLYHSTGTIKIRLT